jgi:hypothetical protein
MEAEVTVFDLMDSIPGTGRAMDSGVFDVECDILLAFINGFEKRGLMTVLLAVNRPKEFSRSFMILRRHNIPTRIPTRSIMKMTAMMIELVAGASELVLLLSPAVDLIVGVGEGFAEFADEVAAKIPVVLEGCCTISFSASFTGGLVTGLLTVGGLLTTGGLVTVGVGLGSGIGELEVTGGGASEVSITTGGSVVSVGGRITVGSGGSGSSVVGNVAFDIICSLSVEKFVRL